MKAREAIMNTNMKSNLFRAFVFIAALLASATGSAHWGGGGYGGGYNNRMFNGGNMFSGYNNGGCGWRQHRHHRHGW